MNARKITALICLFCFLIQIQASNGPSFRVRNLMKDYRQEQGFFGFTIPMWMVRPFVDREAVEIRWFLKKTKKASLLIYDEDNCNPNQIERCRKDFSRLLASEKFVDLLVVNDGDDLVEIKGDIRDNEIKNLFLFVSGDGELVLINLKCAIDLNEFNEFSNTLKKKAALANL